MIKFGKFEINVSEFFVGAICIVVLIYIVLTMTLEEEKLKERTKQLELVKEIVLLENENKIIDERENNNGNSTN